MSAPRILIKSPDELKQMTFDQLQSICDLLLVSENQNSERIYPYKVKWLSVHKNIQSIDQHFRKSSDYKRWKETIEQTKKLGCSFTKVEMNSDFFAHFYELYKNTVGEKERGSMLLPENWIETHTRPDHKPFGYAAYQNGRLIGAMIGFVDLPINQYHVSFLAVEHLGGGVTSGLQQLLLNDVLLAGAHIFYGRDRNLYGVIASPGLIYNKSKFGLTPFPDPDAEKYHYYIINKPDEHDWMFFYQSSQDDEKLNLQIVSNDFKDSEKKYISENIKTIVVEDEKFVIETHKEILQSILL